MRSTLDRLWKRGTLPQRAGQILNPRGFSGFSPSSVHAGERIAEIKQRYGPGDIVTRFITEGSSELLAAVERTERRLAGDLTCDALERT